MGRESEEEEGKRMKRMEGGGGGGGGRKYKKGGIGNRKEGTGLEFMSCLVVSSKDHV